MGERLNVEIVKGGKTLANAYYHWSGYSNTAISIAKTIIDNIPIIKEANDTVLAIRLLESTGAGLTDREVEYSKSIEELKDVQFSECNGRNEGLIAISESEMNTTRYWQEHSLHIYLDEQRMHFDVFFKNKKWEWEEEQERTSDELERVNLNFNDIKFKDIDGFKEFIDNHLTEDFITVFDPTTVFSAVY